jgi:hypothetical protein
MNVGELWANRFVFILILCKVAWLIYPWRLWIGGDWIGLCLDSYISTINYNILLNDSLNRVNFSYSSMSRQDQLHADGKRN